MVEKLYLAGSLIGVAGLGSIIAVGPWSLLPLGIALAFVIASFAIAIKQGESK